MAKTVKQQIEAMMKRKNGATKAEVVAKGINENYARKVLGELYAETKSRKCTACGEYRTAYFA